MVNMVIYVTNYNCSNQASFHVSKMCYQVLSCFFNSVTPLIVCLQRINPTLTAAGLAELLLQYRTVIRGYTAALGIVIDGSPVLMELRSLISRNRIQPTRILVLLMISTVLVLFTFYNKVEHSSQSIPAPLSHCHDLISETRQALSDRSIDFSCEPLGK